MIESVFHLNSLNRDNQQFSVSLPCNILRSVLQNNKVVISSWKCEYLSVFVGVFVLKFAFIPMGVYHGKNKSRQ